MGAAAVFAPGGGAGGGSGHGGGVAACFHAGLGNGEPVVAHRESARVSQPHRVRPGENALAGRVDRGIWKCWHPHTSECAGHQPPWHNPCSAGECVHDRPSVFRGATFSPANVARDRADCGVFSSRGVSKRQRIAGIWTDRDDCAACTLNGWKRYPSRTKCRCCRASCHSRSTRADPARHSSARMTAASCERSP